MVKRCSAVKPVTSFETQNPFLINHRKNILRRFHTDHLYFKSRYLRLYYFQDYPRINQYGSDYDAWDGTGWYKRDSLDDFF